MSVHWTGLPLQCTECFSRKLVMNREFNIFTIFKSIEWKINQACKACQSKKIVKIWYLLSKKLHSVELFSGYPLDPRRTPSWQKLRKTMKFNFFFCNLQFDWTWFWSTVWLCWPGRLFLGTLCLQPCGEPRCRYVHISSTAYFKK